MEYRNPLTIEAENLCVSYERTLALRIHELQVRGNIIGIIGHNGAGKSTFIKALLELIPADSGRLLAQKGPNATRLVPDRDMAFCPETGAVFSDITVKEYLKLWCRLKAGSPHYLFKEGQSILEILELEELLHKKGRELSKGQRQRVQTAAGFFSQPRLFLFDEPFDGLDIQRTHELIELIRSYGSKMSFIISSHRMDVMELLADEMIVLEDGTVRTTGSPKRISQDLCPHFLRISGVPDYERAYEALQIALPHCFLRRSGDTIRIASSQMVKDTVLKTLQKNSDYEIPIVEGEPTLTDAMSLYLRKIKEEKDGMQEDKGMSY